MIATSGVFINKRIDKFTAFLQVNRTLHAETVLPRDVRVDHRRDFFVSEQFLNGANVLSFLKQMRGERVAQGVRAGVFVDAGFIKRLFERFLQPRRRQMMPAESSGARVNA
jgi:hypothetical protein